MSRRVEQMNVFIRKEMAAILARELELPAGALVTVTRVAIEVDLKFAKIYVNILPPERAVEILSVLKKKTGLLQQTLSGRMDTKFSPRITFVLDAEAAKRTRVEDLLDAIAGSEANYDRTI